jgi:hypothetical protein
MINGNHHPSLAVFSGGISAHPLNRFISLIP